MSFLVKYNPKLLISAAVLVAGEGFFGYHAVVTEPVPENAIVVTEGNIVQQVETKGTISGIYKKDISFTRSGIITEVRIRVGDNFLEGQVLATTNTAELAKQLQAARTIAEKEHATLAVLYKNQIAGIRDGTIIAQEGIVTQAEWRVNMLQKEIDAGSLRAPFSGKVIAADKNFKAGKPVRAYDPVIAVTALNYIEFSASLTAMPSPPVQKGMIARSAFAGKEEPLLGEIIGVTRYNDGSVQLLIGATVRDEELVPGMTSEISIETLRREHVLVLPHEFISTTERGNFVKKYDHTTIQPFPVALGAHSDDGFVEILSGVAKGEVIYK